MSAKCQALYRGRLTRAFAELTFSEEILSVSSVQGTVLFYVPGAELHGTDAVCEGRFVRQLTLWNRLERLVLISSPGEGAIAPRGARLPVARMNAVVLPREKLLRLEQWLRLRGKLRECSLIQLAQFAPLAEESYAASIGELYAQRVRELSSPKGDVLRGPLEVSSLFHFLEVSARHWPSARSALLAAYAAFAAFSLELS